MHRFNTFQQLATDNELNSQFVFNVETVENVDLTSEPDGRVTSGKVTPVPATSKSELGEHIPQWGNSLNGRVGALEGRMDTLERDVAVIKTDVAKILQKLT